jgi:N-acetylglutamate synthase-like GNAT family acetyltransferase
MSAPGGCLLVATDDGKVAGCAGFFHVTPDLCLAKRVVVGAAFQRRGIGKRLMKSLMAEAKRLGYSKMQAEAPRSVPALVDFFRAIGFKEAATANDSTTPRIPNRDLYSARKAESASR